MPMQQSQKSGKKGQGRLAEGATQAIEESAANNRCRQSYQLIKKLCRTWKPGQRAIADRNGKIFQDKEEIKKR